ncbi:MAG: phage tail protein [Chloroflexota bacterium]
MAITISTGTGIDIAKTYGSAISMTALTNASEAVATLAAGHALVVGDIIEVTSGWGRLNKRIVRIKTVAVNDVTMEGINTTSTTLYPAGSGTGTVRKITAWDEVTQIKEVSVSGGDQQYVDITTIADVTAKQAPTIRNAVALTLTVMDDPALAWYATVNTAADTDAVAAVRMRFPNGSKLLGNGYWSLQKTPNIAKNDAITARVDVSYIAEATRYST